MKACTGIVVPVLAYLVALPLRAQQDVPAYVPEALREIPIGRGPGELGRVKLPGGAGAQPSEPLLLDDEVHIVDNANWRINVYDPEMLAKGETAIPHDSGHLPMMTVHPNYYSNGDLLSVWRGVVHRLRPDGSSAFAVKPEGAGQLSIVNGEYWLVEDHILYVREGGGLGAVDAAGRVLTEQEGKSLAERLKSASRLRQRSSALREAIDAFLERERLFLVGDRLLVDHPDKYLDFYRTVGESAGRGAAKNVVDIAMTARGGLVYGFDRSDNAYWRFRTGAGNTTQDSTVFVAAPDGTIVAGFRIDGPGVRSIAPNGDIYIANLQRGSVGEWVYLYSRVRRRW